MSTSASSPPLRQQIQELERRLEELQRRLPAHSIPPALIAELDALDEALAALRQQQQTAPENESEA